MTIVELLWQRLQSLTYLVSGPLQENFADPAVEKLKTKVLYHALWISRYNCLSSSCRVSMEAPVVHISGAGASLSMLLSDLGEENQSQTVQRLHCPVRREEPLWVYFFGQELRTWRHLQVCDRSALRRSSRWCWAADVGGGRGCRSLCWDFHLALQIHL